MRGVWRHGETLTDGLDVTTLLMKRLITLATAAFTDPIRPIVGVHPAEPEHA